MGLYSHRFYHTINRNQRSPAGRAEYLSIHQEKPTHILLAGNTEIGVTVGARLLLEYRMRKGAAANSPFKEKKLRPSSISFCVYPHHYHSGKLGSKGHTQKTAGNPARRKQFKALRLCLFIAVGISKESPTALPALHRLSHRGILEAGRGDEYTLSCDHSLKRSQKKGPDPLKSGCSLGTEDINMSA